MLHVKLPDESDLYGIIQATNFRDIPPELDSLPALYDRLKKKFAKYRHLDQERDADALILRQALINGELKEAQPVSKIGGFNKIHRSFFLDMFARNKKIATGLQTFGFEFFAVGTEYNAINFADTLLGNEIYRRQPDTIAEDGATAIYATTLLSALQGNPALNTTVALTSISPFELNLASPTGATVGTRIQLVSVVTGTFYATITNIAGPQITLTDIMDIGGTSYPAGFPNPKPSSGDKVDAVHCEGALITRADASLTLNTGVILNRRLFINPKRTGSIADSALYDVIFTFTSAN